MIALAIVNYRTVDATLACLRAIDASPRDGDAIYVLDNAPASNERRPLQEFCKERAPRFHWLCSESNLGFAGGANLLIDEILSDARINAIVFLNSDTQPTAGFVQAMQDRLDAATQVDLVAARMLDAADATVDSLGITLFRSTLASNRKRAGERLLGPSGGCMLITRRLLSDLRSTHHEWFDADFFCYAEDTDLVVRARWLDYRPAYAADAVIYHTRSLSSGGPSNDFVLYHGIRNSIWWLVKNAPLGWFLRSLPWFIALHAAIWIRHLRRGKGRVLWRLYRDAIKGIPAMRKKRAVIMKSRRVPASEFSNWVEQHFYERGYLKRAWRELFKPASKN